MSEMVKKQIILNNVLLMRVSLTKPYVGKDAKIDPATGKPAGKYHVDAVFGTDHPQFAELQNIIRGVAADKWKEPGQAQQILGMIAPNNQRFPLQKGDQYRPGKLPYAGKVYLSASNSDQPTIIVSENGVNIANQGTPTILTPSHPCWPYEGAFANVHVEFYGYMYGGTSPGISCGLLGVQFFKHGTRLRSSSVSSVGEFGIVPSAADGPPPTGAAQPLAGSSGLI